MPWNIWHTLQEQSLCCWLCVYGETGGNLDGRSSKQTGRRKIFSQTKSRELF